jgi:glycerol-3-phosphate acyltransferase PlsY
VTGATYYFIAAFIPVLCFSRDVAIVGLLFLVMGDSIAALIGTTYGAHKIGDKSAEGSLACFLVCSVIGVVLLGWIGIPGAIAATLSELVPLPVDDNLRIPLISGIIMQLLS